MKEKEFYLTQEGLARIKAEYDSLKKLRQSMLSGEDIPEALHSEELNPEYVHLHEDLNFLESKISEFEFVLKNYKPIKSLKGVVDIGSTVTVDIGGDESNFTIVETLEASPSIGRISKSLSYPIQ